jgi:alpha-1,2-mannosyltransferase
MSARTNLSLAELPWLHAARATAWLRILAVVSATVVVVWIALARGGLDVTGKPIGTDFMAYWTAARLLIEGAPAVAVYQDAPLAALQTATFGGADVGYAPFPYPPSFLLICLPLGLLPYLGALAAWMTVTGYAYWRVIRAWLGRSAGLALPALAFPAVLINLGHGQNAFLTTALFGGGALLLGRRDFAAGLLLGALAFKPHLGLLIPVVLLASRNWRAFAGAAVSSLGLTAASAALFGLEAWQAYPAQVEMMRAVVEQGALNPAKLQSVFGALRLWGAPLPFAYAAQVVCGLAAAATVAIFAWRWPNSPALGPVLVAATLLIGPYLLDYDLLLAAIPLAWLFAQGRDHGFQRWEKLVMLAAFLLPLVSRIATMNFHVALAPAVLTALVAVVVRRGVAVPEVGRPEPR